VKLAFSAADEAFRREFVAFIEARKALVPTAIRGDTVWCAGMSEPGAGSDLANLATRAVPVGS
jgi:alkylation response protein AidB-like acyl-CoA dehydrogenase